MKSPTFLDRHGFGEQIVQFEHFHVAFAHLQHEVVVILLRLVDPEDIVEQQGGGVARGEPLVSQPGTAHHHRAQLADFAMNAKGLHLPLLD